MTYTASKPFFFTLLASVFLLTACGDSDGSLFGPPDYSSVPDLPDTTSVEKITIEEGLHYYVIEEGSGPATVQNREQISAYVTLRRENQSVVNSSYVNGSESPLTFSVTSFGPVGFQLAVEGMKIGERRVIVISPEWGFGGEPASSQFYYLRDDQLTYDIKVDNVF